MYQDILLHLDTYPDPTPLEALPRIVDFCSTLGAQVSALTVQVRLAVKSNPIAERLVGLKAMAKAQEAQCKAAGDQLLARFDALASEAGLQHETLAVRADFYFYEDDIARSARTHDLIIVPQTTRLDGQRGVAEAVLFSSGRPVLVLPLAGAEPPDRLRRVAVAWDGSRAAARAVADALPVLRLAEDVDIIVVPGDKPKPHAAPVGDLLRHLSRHGVHGHVVTLEADHEPVAELIVRHARERADLLVMGGYGHARMTEFILGGVTERVLWDPPVPVLLSH